MTHKLLLTILCMTAAVAWAADDLPPKPASQAWEEAERRQKDAREKLTTALAALEQVWKKAKSPPIIILCGYTHGITDAWKASPSAHVPTRRSAPDTAPTPVTIPPESVTPRAPDSEIRGSLAPFRYLSHDLTFRDPLGVAQTIEGQVSERLQQAGIDNIISGDALSESRARLVASYEAGSAYEVLQSLFSEQPASYVLKIVLSQSEQGRDPKGNVEHRVRVRYDLLLPGSGRLGGADTFEARAGSSAEFLDAYADRITLDFAKLLTRELSRRTSGGELLTLKLENADAATVKLMEAALQQDDSERFVWLRRGTERTVGGRRISDLEIRYRGTAFELLDTLNRILPERCNLTPFTTDAVDDRLTLRLDQRPAERDPSELSRWEILADPQHPEHEKTRAEFTAEYKRKGQPRIGVLVNRSLVDADLAGEAGQILRNRLGQDLAKGLAFQRLSRDGSIDAQALDTEAMQTAVNSELLGYGFTVVEPEQVRSRIVKDAKDQGEIQQDADIESAILRLDTADLVVRCVGRKLGNEAAQYKYTFNVLRITDGVIPASAMESILAADFKGGRDPLERLARQATAQLVDRLWLHWTGPARSLVRVTGAASADALLAVREALGTKVHGGIRSAELRSRAGAGDQGIGEIDLEWDGDYDRLITALQAQKDRLPFDLDVTASTREVLILRVKREFAALR